MSLLKPGYWHSTYWPKSYWNVFYWQRYEMAYALGRIDPTIESLTTMLKFESLTSELELESTTPLRIISEK